MIEKIIYTISKEEAKEVEAYMDFFHHPQGTILTTQFAWEKDVIFLMKGDVSIFQLAILSRRLCAIQLADIPAPAILGGVSVFMEQLQNETIVAASDIKYFLLSEENYQKLCDEKPALAVKVLHLMGQQTSYRFINMQERVQSRMIAQTKDINALLYLLKKYIGTVRICTPRTAQKLFNLDEAVN